MSSRVAPRFPIISGIATLTMEVSRNSMIVAAITVTTMSHRSPGVMVSYSGSALPGEGEAVPFAPAGDEGLGPQSGRPTDDEGPPDRFLIRRPSIVVSLPPF